MKKFQPQTQNAAGRVCFRRAPRFQLSHCKLWRSPRSRMGHIWMYAAKSYQGVHNHTTALHFKQLLIQAYGISAPSKQVHRSLIRLVGVLWSPTCFTAQYCNQRLSMFKNRPRSVKRFLFHELGNCKTEWRLSFLEAPRQPEYTKGCEGTVAGLCSARNRQKITR